MGDGLSPTWNGDDANYQALNSIDTPETLPKDVVKPTISRTGDGTFTSSITPWYRANKKMNTMIDNAHFGLKYENKNTQLPVDDARDSTNGFKIDHDLTDSKRAYSNRFYN
ncbi:MAG: hypothetical protein LBV22_01470, partial [Mycoplasmataceae bacterium]|nr:hypothetical protein [Mycoplasmataceae bacterium]